MFPTNVVLINFEGLLTKGESIFAEKLPCLFRNSMSNLLAEINAISIPEKNAEIKILKIIIGIKVVSTLRRYENVMRC